MSQTILDLPNEMIAHIFSFVSHKKDRGNLALICKKFHKIVRKQSKKHYYLNLYGPENALPIFAQSDEFPFQTIVLQSFQIEQYRDIWLKHGVEITQMSLSCTLKDLETLGSELKELFPNLITLSCTLEDLETLESTLKELYINIPKEAKSSFSDNIKNLDLKCSIDQLKLLGSILKLFPGLNRQMLEIYNIYVPLKDSEVQELKIFLDEWSPYSENIELIFDMNYQLNFLGSFKELINEKLSFRNLTLDLTPENINILKDFFSVPRHIRYLVISPDTAPDSTFCTFVEKNVITDLLGIHNPRHDPDLSKLRSFINAPGVKVINFTGVVYLAECIHFNPKALLKIKEITLRGVRGESALRIPLFRNLRYLDLNGFYVGNEELTFIANTFPYLEDLKINELNATNGHPLTNLKHIRHLKISNSINISNAFFNFGTKLPNLKTLFFSDVPNLSSDGVKSIIANCPRLEIIRFMNCDQITKKCVNLITQKLFYINIIELHSELIRRSNSNSTKFIRESKNKWV